MLFYVARRFLYMGIILLVLSMVTFIIIQLPPGDYLTSYIAQLQKSGQIVDKAQIASLKKQYGLDIPIYRQYFNLTMSHYASTGIFRNRKYRKLIRRF